MNRWKQRVILWGVLAALCGFLLWRNHALLLRNRELTEKLADAEERMRGLEEELAVVKTQGVLWQRDEAPRAYLTFDDGPHANTDRILDILQEYGICATFFVNGSDSEDALATYRRILDEGHLMANHTMTHRYKEIYSGVDAFMDEVYALEDLMREKLGYTMPKILRLPGGSNNAYLSSSVREELLERLLAEGYRYFDWNVSGEDSVRRGIPADRIYEEVLSSTEGRTDVVILLHSGAIADGTVQALPRILDYYLAKGYHFHRLDEEDAPQIRFASP